MSETSVLDGIIIGAVGGAVGGAVAGITVWFVQQLHRGCNEKRDKDRVYKWLQDYTADKDGERYRSTRAIASWNNLAEDRVRYICSLHDKIYLSTGKEPDRWGLNERRDVPAPDSGS